MQLRLLVKVVKLEKGVTYESGCDKVSCKRFRKLAIGVAVEFGGVAVSFLKLISEFGAT